MDKIESCSKEGALQVSSFLLSLVLFGAGAKAQDQNLCDNLSRFSCAPGSYEDGTGRVHSDRDIEEKLGQIRTKYQARIADRWKKELRKEENAYFRETAMAVLGLKNSPDCRKGSPTFENCERNLMEGLSRYTEIVSMSSLRNGNLEMRQGNIRELGLVSGQALFQEVSKEIGQDIQKEIAQPALEKKIREKVFPQVRDLLVQRLHSLPIADQKKEMMIKKIKGIRFQGSDCQLGGAAVDNLLVPNAHYNPNANTFQYCNGFLLRSSSEFQIAYVIAHELAHSIDPCYISKGPEDYRFNYSKTNDKSKMESEYPIPNLLGCLRGANSMNAKSGRAGFDSREISAGYGGGMMGTPGGGMMVGQPAGIPAGLAQASFCNHEEMGGMHSLEGPEQIGESFSDWIAMELTPAYIEKNFKLTADQYRIGYSNIWRPVCSILPKDSGPAKIHPDTSDRIDKMILVQPKVRAQMNCPPQHPEHIYCDPAKPSAAGPANQSNPPAKPASSPGVK